MRTVKVVRAGQWMRGVVEQSRLQPTTPYPYHVTIYTHSGPQYLGVTSTLAEAVAAIKENT